MRPYSRFSRFRSRHALLLAMPLTVLACTLGQAATELPTPSALPTVTLSVTEGIQTTTVGQAPATCTPRSDWPSMVISPGDTLSSIAAQVGSTVDQLAAANCISNPAAITAGETLYVPTLPPGTGAGASASIPTALPNTADFPTAANQAPACDGTYQWFFNFGFGASDSGCPGPVITSNAVGENFQGGRVYRYDPMPGQSQATIYVIYNDSTWVTYPDTWTPDQAMNDPSIVPPDSWVQPTGAIGKVWREQPGVRDKLGWAYAPEAPFAGRRQTSSSGANYIDHGFRNAVLRLDGANGDATSWTVVGTY